MVSGSLGLLHTSAVHVPVFDALAAGAHPGLRLRHLVDTALLARARAEGPEAVRDSVLLRLREAVADGATAVLCTCSTIGAVAEELAPAVGVSVLRVDRPMAAAAVAAGERVVIAATVESTLEPTAALVREEAERAGRRLRELRPLLVPGAWELFERGDSEGCARRVAEAVDAVQGADAVVLAQASMAAATGLTRTRLPVLSSPAGGLAAAAALVRTAQDGGVRASRPGMRGITPEAAPFQAGRRTA